MIDYETLRIVWWLLLGVLLIGFAVMDGFDLGAAILMPWLGKTDLERRVCINCIGPTWEGNQVWFIFLQHGQCYMPFLFPDFIWPCYGCC